MRRPAEMAIGGDAGGGQCGCTGRAEARVEWQGPGEADDVKAPSLG